MRHVLFWVIFALALAYLRGPGLLVFLIVLWLLWDRINTWVTKRPLE